MGRIETALKEEISRLARKEARQLQARTAQDVRRLKKRVADLQAQIAALKRERARELSKTRMAEAAQSAAARQGGRIRLSPVLIKKLRHRLKISQPDLAALLDVSASAVGFWEVGRVQPRADTKARIAALRKLGRRDVQRLLAEKKAASARKTAKKKAKPKKKTTTKKSKARRTTRK